MDLALHGIYSAALRALRNNLLVYLLLLLWGLAQGLILIALLTAGGVVWLTAVTLAASGPSPGSATLLITVAYLGTILLVLAVLSAATKAGVLAFGAGIRRGERATTLHFLRGILRFTLPLFMGGLVVGMLSCLPALAFMAFLKLSLAGVVSDLFTRGWNFAHSIDLLMTLWNALLVAGAFQMLIFFWIAPWDEMVVLYEMPYPEALQRSFGFVFSRRHFLRVLSLVLANVLIAQLLLLLANLGAFREGLPQGFSFAYLSVLMHAPSSSLTSFFQFVTLPFFAFTQLYLLPFPEPQPAITDRPGLAFRPAPDLSDAG